MTVKSTYRTHTCGALDLKDDGQEVKLSGWCHRIRDHGGVLFIDLRDDYGITQCVVDIDCPARETAHGLHAEFVVQIEGRVRIRPKGTQNDNLGTGAIEVLVTGIQILGPVEGPLPFPVFGDLDYPEDLRLKYRFLDLRRDKLAENLRRRAAIIGHLREAMVAKGFLEVQTPILTASSPEGARDFLVPSRLHPGKFYALPQAPQQFKQLLMVSGIDRYFQIAPCFRDEAARADRSPGEFYQLDIEMAFVEQEDVFAVVEPMLIDLFRTYGGDHSVTPKFPRIPYHEAMLRYGCDKPDLRNPLVIWDVGPALAAPDMTLAPFKTGVGRAIYVSKGQLGERSRRWFKDMEGWAIAQGAKGLGYLTLQSENGIIGWGGPLAKFFGEQATEILWRQIQGEKLFDDGDIVFFAVGKEAATVKFAGLLRTKLAEELGLIPQDRFEFCWVVDYPMFERNEETGQIEFSHNPFSMPQGGLDALNGSDPLDVLAYQYDIVCNGIELSSGAIRNHRPDVMKRAFEIAGYSEADLEAKFGGMLSAFRCGAPPHGGIAPGIDRMVMMLCDAQNLREVIAFPLNQKGEDLMMGAPSEALPAQMRELHIRSVPPVKV